MRAVIVANSPGPLIAPRNRTLKQRQERAARLDTQASDHLRVPEGGRFTGNGQRTERCPGFPLIHGMNPKPGKPGFWVLVYFS